MVGPFVRRWQVPEPSHRHLSPPVQVPSADYATPPPFASEEPVCPSSLKCSGRRLSPETLTPEVRSVPSERGRGLGGAAQTPATFRSGRVFPLRGLMPVGSHPDEGD